MIIYIIIGLWNLPIISLISDAGNCIIVIAIVNPTGNNSNPITVSFLFCFMVYFTYPISGLLRLTD